MCSTCSGRHAPTCQVGRHRTRPCHRIGRHPLPRRRRPRHRHARRLRDLRTLQRASAPKLVGQRRRPPRARALPGPAMSFALCRPPTTAHRRRVVWTRRHRMTDCSVLLRRGHPCHTMMAMSTGQVIRDMMACSSESAPTDPRVYRMPCWSCDVDFFLASDEPRTLLSEFVLEGVEPPAPNRSSQPARSRIHPVPVKSLGALPLAGCTAHVGSASTHQAPRLAPPSAA